MHEVTPMALAMAVTMVTSSLMMVLRVFFFDSFMMVSF